MKTFLLITLAAMGLSTASRAQDADTDKPAAKPVELSETDKALRMNFREAPLELVLNYMSEAAGFIINIAPGTEVKGKVNVWSNTPLTKDEAVELLNKVLHQN